MQTKRLYLKFQTESDKKYTLNVPHPVNSVDKTAVTHAANQLIQQNQSFVTPLTSLSSAQVVIRDVIDLLAQ